jgi:hypothetical protein
MEMLIGATRENVNRQLRGRHSGSAVRPDFVAQLEQTEGNGEERAGRMVDDREIGANDPKQTSSTRLPGKRAPDDAELSGAVLP